MKLDNAWKSVGLSFLLAMFVSERYTFLDTWLIVGAMAFAVGGCLVFLDAFMEAD